MRKRILTVVVCLVLGLGAFAAGQVQRSLQAPSFTVQADKMAQDASETITLTGGVSFTVNGVLVRAERAVVKGREVALEGNVRLTLPPPK